MSTQSFPIDGTLVCLGGYWYTGIADGGHTAYEMRGVESAVTVYFHGPTLALLCRFNGQGMKVAIDGGSATSVTDPNANAWGAATFATGLTDAYHTAVIYGPDVSSNGFLVDAAAGVQVTGSAPAVATPPGYGPFFGLTDPANSGKFVATDPQLTLTTANTVIGYDDPIAYGWGFHSFTSGGLASYSGTNLNTANADCGVRFRASTTSVVVWGGAASTTYTLSRNGVDIATVAVGSGGPAIGYVTLATGLDPTAADYVITPQGGATGYDYRVGWILGVMLSPGGTLSAPPARGRMVVLGNSITAAQVALPHNGFVYRIAQQLGLDPVNRGINGRTLHDYTGSNGTALADPNTTLAGVNQSAAVTSVPNVKRVILFLGTNDARNVAGVSPPRDASTIQAEAYGLIVAVVAGCPGVPIDVWGPLDSGDTSAVGVTGVEARLPAYRTALRGAVAQVANPLVRYVPTDGWIDYTNGVDTLDQLHPSAAGYTKIVSQYVATLPVMTLGQSTIPAGNQQTVTVSGTGLVGQFTFGGTAGASVTVAGLSGTRTWALTVQSANAGTLTVTDASGASASLTVVPAQPAAPAVVGASQQATVAWTATAGAATYVLYRTPASGSPTPVYAGSALTYTDTGLTNGTAYAYTVVAVDSSGDTSATSAATAVTPAVVDYYGASTVGLDGPYTRAVAVTPSDASDLAWETTALEATGAGNVNVKLAGAPSPVVLPIVAGEPLKVRATRVYATGTTATGIVALA